MGPTPQPDVRVGWLVVSKVEALRFGEQAKKGFILGEAHCTLQTSISVLLGVAQIRQQSHCSKQFGLGQQLCPQSQPGKGPP